MDLNYVKYAAAAVLAFALVFVLLPSQASVEVENVKAANQSFGPPLVTATLTNSGPAIDVSYWVETDRSDRKHCQGTVRVGAEDRKDLSFRCPGLAGHAGGFTLQTGPAG